MAEHNQEPEITAATTITTKNDGNTTKNQDNVTEESIDFNLLRLDSTSTSTTYFHSPCTACGCCGSGSSSSPVIPATNNVFSSCNNNNKRRPPDPNAPFLDPPPQDHKIPKKPKKLFPDNPQETTTTATCTIPSLHDYSKITLPCTSSFLGFGATKPSPGLRRSHSDPCDPFVVPAFGSLSGSGANQTPQSPPESVKMAGATTTSAAATTPASKAMTASLPPLPPLLRRTVSDPSPNNSSSRSSSSNDSVADLNSNYKFLKTMKDYMKEMNQWWDEFLPDQVTGEEYEEDKGTEDTNAAKADSVRDLEEAVCVETTGECLIIRFKCPCSKGYKILLCGQDCYYKLM